MNFAPFSALLVGENSLLIECATALLERGHVIRGVVSPTPAVRDWAAAMGIAVVDFATDLAPFDHLFSVVNLGMLPAEVLALPRGMAINFHDALLPENAGVHASAWAVHNRSDRHGVTWHVMTERADAGDILVQCSFELDQVDTSHTVNLKCLRAGLASFIELMDGLATGSIARIPQDLSQRTYHGWAKRPEPAISWRRSAGEIHAAIRACDFGPHPNEFGTVKLALDPGWVVVRGAEIGAPSTAAPGTVVAVADSAITVATTSHDIRLSGLCSLDGTTSNLDIGLGERLPEPDVNSLASMCRDAAKHERYWVERLTGLTPLVLPSGAPCRDILPVPLPAWVGSGERVLEMLLGFLARVSGETGFDIGLHQPRPELFAQVVPVRHGDDVGLVLARGSYLRDVAVRHPRLGSTAELPVIAALVGDLDKRVEEDANLLVRITRDGRGCDWTCRDETARTLCDSFVTFLNRVRELGVEHAPLVTEPVTLRGPSDIAPMERVPQLVMAQAHRRPEAIAVRHDEHAITYGELADRVAALTATLTGRGIGPGALVGVHMRRSIDLVVALLAVLESGAAYVPIDPIYPDKRIADMLDDARAALVLTDVDNVDPATHYDRQAASDLAYVIYTSGSTGKPKGVRVTHPGLTNLLLSMARTPGCGEGDTLLAVSTVCFDIAALELFLPLITGGTTVMVSTEDASDPAALQRRIHAHRPTIMQATPATWSMLIAAGWTGAPELKVLCGGEALPRDLADELLARTDQVWNVYGPTETTIWSTVSRVCQDTPITIGTPIANTMCCVLDAQLRPLPPGIPGELCIGGDGVAEGYHNRPELTAERFRTGPAGERVYRTGDLARVLPDGRLDCLGRMDNQVKVNGYRIELGEIEAGLREHPAVRQAVTVVRDGAIVAFVDATETDGLREYLAERLPAYMIPARFVPVIEFPLTPNGKIDRKALHEPAPTAPSTRTALDAVLANTATLLGVDSVRPDHRFRDLGVDSMAAMRLQHDICTELGVRLPAMAVYRHPTPAALAAAIDGEHTAEPASPEDDLHLPADIAVSRHVLLTGATGFLGAFLLRDLVRHTGAVVHCLVRAADEPTGRKRLRSVLETYLLWDDEMDRRIVVLPGDLSQPLLGLPDGEFDDLARIVDVVYHAGAEVNALQDYPALRSPNVLGTQEALRLAARHRGAAFHHVSTNEVFPHTGMPKNEHAATGPLGELNGGYAQSKWAAEHLVIEAGRRGLRTAIHRPSRIFGDRHTGACQTNDLLWRVIKGCVQARAIPTAITATYDVVPVDWVSRGIIALTEHAGQFHLTNPQRLAWEALIGHLRDHGYHLDEMPVHDWADRIRTGHRNAALPVLDVFLDQMSGHGWSDLAIDNAQTLSALDDTAGSPHITADVLTTYLRYHTRTGFLPMPTPK